MSAAIAQELGRVTHELNKLQAEYLGKGQRPQSGCQFATVCAAEASVLVEYEFTPAEDPIYDVESPGVGPGHDASLTVIHALINGKWIDPREVFDERIVEQWEQALIEEQLEEA